MTEKKLVKILTIPRLINAFVSSNFEPYRYIFVYGIFGFLKYKVKEPYFIDVYHNKIKIASPSFSMFKTYLKIINLLITSVTLVTTKFLELRGVGYKYKIHQNFLFMVLGFSHLKKIEIPKNIATKLINNKLIKFSTHNYQTLNIFIYNIKKKSS